MTEKGIQQLTDDVMEYISVGLPDKCVSSANIDAVVFIACFTHKEEVE